MKKMAKMFPKCVDGCRCEKDEVEEFPKVGLGKGAATDCEEYMRDAGLGSSIDNQGGDEWTEIMLEVKKEEGSWASKVRERESPTGCTSLTKAGERESPSGGTSLAGAKWSLAKNRWTRASKNEDNGEQGGERSVSRDCKIYTAIDGPMDLKYRYDDWEMALDDKIDCHVAAGFPQSAGFSSSPSSPLSIPFLRGKSDAGGAAPKPTSSGRSKINPTSPQPTSATLSSEWSTMVPKILNDCEKLDAEQVLMRLKHIAKRMEADIAHDYWTSKEGQEELKKMSEEREKKPTAGINIFDYTVSSKASLCPMSAPAADEWYEVELTADTGACDTVMPKAMCSGIPIVDSPQSLKGLEYEVATGQAIPNLGQRCCELWTDGASSGKAINVQVADVHKALLSLSRCADMGFESRFGSAFGCLIDTQTNEVIPLQRRGNLYILKAWIRAAPFGRQGGKR
jgi:hypothetical protein